MKLTRSFAVLSTVALLALSVPAFAGGPPYNVEVGRSSTGSHAFTATSKGDVVIEANGLGGSVQIGCTGSTLTGFVHAGPNTTGAAVAEVTSSTWTGCIGPASIVFSFAPDHSNPWGINAIGNTATSSIGDVIEMTVSGLDLAVDTSPPGLCSFDLDGTIDAEFDELTEDLTIIGTLNLSGVSGCFGAVSPGPAQFEVDYDVYTPTGVINITD